MTADRRGQISDIYCRALERPAGDRPAFVKEACAGDEALREEVESLLGYEPAARSFLETPAGQVVADAVPMHSPMLNRQVGPYTIVAPLGEGGMGEVYRARDSNLGRDVAIKVLPRHLTSNPERRARFAREARLLATLNHPNIGTIYGLEHSDGITALVLELVEGPTLAERLAQGPLTLAQALGIAKQIAEALEAAHEKGIVHRDLKPANIVLQDAPGGSGSASGAVRAKVLDFGLAKMTALGPEADQRPPDSVDGTEDGRLLGSPAYMSPEQARGERVDKRTDVWGFGCVLFEMLTGRVAFEGKTVPETLAAVLEHRPEWSALPATTPETIRRLVRRCLEKDPAHRLRDIGDARLEIDEVLSPPTLPRAVTVQPSASRLRMWLVIASLAAIAAIAAAGWYRWRSTTDNPAAPPSQLTRLTFDEGLQTDPTLEPHGRFVAYSSNKAGNFDIYTQPVAGGGNAVQVTKHPAHDWQPDWSIQDQLVFRSERDGGGLYVVAQTGGHERQIANFGYQPRWSPDGNRILFKCSAPGVFVCTVGLRGGSPRECKACGPVQGFGWFLDSRHVSILRSEPSPQHRGVPD